ncbi:Zn(II)2Cys6 transcription factor [Aspergillus undulatus]|uniref:Zn(II)2Cys6 transcription factor n=1 Tax=Aspergillus undulatus TaxID=1810928 RepID=UPI003CCDF046
MATGTGTSTNRRVTRPRSRNGCITCKLRHVKCTEEKPSCAQCLKSGRKCDGYDPDNASQAQLRARIAERHKPIDRDTFCADHRLVLRQETRTERRYVDFFYTRTSTAFAGFYDSKLWSYLIPQFGEREPSVRHAMTAIGAMHSRVQITAAAALQDGSGTAPSERFVLEEYNKSIQTLVKSLSAARGESIDLTLTTCCLFVCLEMLRENQKEALDHIEAGLRIIHKHEQSSSSSTWTSELYLQLRDLFLRLNLQASFMGRLLIPLKFTSPDTTRSSAGLMVYGNMLEARSHLDNLMNKALLFIRSVGIMREEREPALQLSFEAEQEALCQEMAAWRWSHDKLLSKLGSKISTSDLCASYLLRIYYHTALLWVLVVLARDEDAYDNYTADFETVVSHAEEVVRLTGASLSTSSSSSSDKGKSPAPTPTLESTSASPASSFSLEGELIGPLYYASCRCRHPSIRRRALTILKHYSKREGMWDAQLYARVAKLVIEVEESQCVTPPMTERDIGSLSRVYEEIQSKEKLENPTQVVLYMKPEGVDGPWWMRSVFVEW